MRLSELLNSAAHSITSTPPASLASGLSASVAFLLSLVLLRDTLGEAAVSIQFLAAGAGGLIAAFLASRLAAYLVRVAGLWAGWPGLSRIKQTAAAAVLAIVSAALVVTILLLVS